jgi:hypothetical protein
MADAIVLVIDPLAARIALGNTPAPAKRVRQGTNHKGGELAWSEEGDDRLAFFEIPLPPMALAGEIGADIDLRLRWTSEEAGGNVRWGVAVARCSEGDSVDNALGSETAATVAHGGAGQENETAITLTNALDPAPPTTKAQRLIVRVRRINTGVASNLDGEASLIISPAVLSLQSRLEIDGGRYRRAAFSTTTTLTRSAILGRYLIGQTNGGAVVLTLPDDMTPSDDGRVFPVIRDGSNDLTLASPAGGAIIGYADPIVFTADHDSIMIMYMDGGLWQVLAA